MATFFVLFFFFKQKTAYEMRIRYWISTCALPICGVGKALSWTLQPRALLRGRLDIDVDIDHAARHIPLRIAMHRVEASDIDLTLPASTLGIAVPSRSEQRSVGKEGVRTW